MCGERRLSESRMRLCRRVQAQATGGSRFFVVGMGLGVVNGKIQSPRWGQGWLKEMRATAAARTGINIVQYDEC